MTSLIKTHSIDDSLFRPLRPRDLVSRLGTSEEMVRNFLRKYYSETHVKRKLWYISPELAHRIETDYKNMIKAREAERKQRIERELAGEVND